VENFRSNVPGVSAMVGNPTNGGDAESLALEFLPRLKDELHRIRRDENFQRNADAFVYWAISQLSPSLSPHDVAHSMRPAGKDDKGIDAAWWDKNAIDQGRKIGAFYLAQGKCGDTLLELDRYGARAARELFSGFAWLTSPNQRLKPELKAVRDEFEVHLAGGEWIRLVVLVGGLATAGLWREAAVLESKLDVLYPNGKITVEVLDLPKLDSLYIDRLETGDIPAPASAKFRIRSEYHYRPYGLQRALVGQIPASEIHKLVKENQLSLFSKNLRVPISHSRYNFAFRASLESQSDRGNIWYYNNGITAICRSFDFIDEDVDDERFRLVEAKELTIVNGCQTCATVYDCLEDWIDSGKPTPDISDVDVLIRLIPTGSVGGSSENEFARNVARYTNSQNPITARDLRANEPEQMRFREELRSRGYFFEVKDGEWDRRNEQDPDYFRQFSRKKPLVSNEVAGQYYRSFWMGEPIESKMNKRALFEEAEVYSTVYGFKTKSEAMLLPWLVQSWIDRWRKIAGLKKRAAKGSRRQRISRPLVYTHGNLVLLAMVGYGLKKNSGATLRSDSVRLGRAIDVMTQLLEGSALAAINTAATIRALDSMLSRQMDLLYRFVRAKLDADPEVTVRNLLVRETVFGQIVRELGDRIARNTAQVKGLLVG
jgi:hypothetical protein